MSTALGVYHDYAHLVFMGVEGEAHYPSQIDRKKTIFCNKKNIAKLQKELQCNSSQTI